jgi:hypothetical protein
MEAIELIGTRVVPALNRGVADVIQQ